MKFFRLDLLTLLISLFILGSCKNPDSIGLPVDPAQALQTNLIDTVTINTTTVLDDSVLTTNLGKVPLGFFKDPIFGTTEANLALSLNLPGLAAFTAPTLSPVIDSVILALPYADGFYGDSLTTNYKVNVYQLREPVIAQSYYNNKTWAYNNSILLGSKTFFPRPKAGFKITAIVTGAPDTLIKVKPQLRIKIDPTFVYSKIFGISASQLSTNSVFQNYIKGLYVTFDQTRPGPGGIMFFNVPAAADTMNVYYHTTNADGTHDTLSIAFPAGGPHAVNIKHNYATAAAALNTQLANPAASYNTLYLQGLSGLRAKVSFPYLKKLLADQQVGGNDIVVNRAELVVTPVAGTDVPYMPTPRLTMYRNDVALQRQLIPDAYAGDLHYIAVGSFGGFYDFYHRSYHYIITGYIEDLMRGKLLDYGTYIAPADTVGVSTGTATVNVGTAADVAARAVVGGNKTSGYKMKLNILYSKVTK